MHIDGGLHSSEVAGPQHTPLLLYDIVAHAPNEPEMAAILDNVILMLWPTINPDGHQMVADWLHDARRHAHRSAGHAPAEPVSGVRRPRQQPRRLHAEHGRVAVARAHVAAVGAEHHLRAPSVVAVSDAHLAAAVRRADRDARAVPRVEPGEHDRHGDRAAAEPGREGRRHAHGHRLRRVVSGLHRLQPRVQEHPGVLDRDAGHGPVAAHVGSPNDVPAPTCGGRRRST